MPEAGVRFNWYGARVQFIIEGATEKALAQVAYTVLQRAVLNIQANGQIDTSFMANSGYVITGRGPEGGPLPSGEYRSAKTGQMVERSAVATRPTPPEGGAAVHFAAEYAIYQEMANSYLYRALEQVMPQVKGIVEALYQREVR